MSDSFDRVRRPLPPPRRPRPDREPPSLDELARSVGVRPRSAESAPSGPGDPVAASALAQSSGRTRSSYTSAASPPEAPIEPERPSDIFEMSLRQLTQPAKPERASSISHAPVARDVATVPPPARRGVTIVVASAVGALVGASFIAAAPFFAERLEPGAAASPDLAHEGVAQVVTQVATRLPSEAAANETPDAGADAPEPPKPAVGFTPRPATASPMRWPPKAQPAPVRSDGDEEGAPSTPAGAAEKPTVDEGDDAPKSFDDQAARAAIAAAMARASACGDGQTRGRGRIVVTIAPSGRATQALLVDAPNLVGTPVGSCIARSISGISVPPFEGAPVTVSKSIAFH